MMKKGQLITVISCLSATFALSLSLGAISYAYYEKTKVLQNSNSENVLIETDQANYRNVTFRVKAKPSSSSMSVYLYDKSAAKYVKMSPVDENRCEFETKYLAKIGTFEYRYFIADSDDPSSNIAYEKADKNKYRSLTITETSESQLDRWVVHLVFNINYETYGQTMYICGKMFNPDHGPLQDRTWYEQYMYHDGNNNWNLSIDIEQYISSSECSDYYEYIYRNKHAENVGGHPGGYESFNGNRNLFSLLGATNATAYHEIPLNNKWDNIAE